MKAEFDEKPLGLSIYDAQGKVMVCWNIEQVVKEPIMPDESPKTIWVCDIAIAENNSREAVIQAIIRSRYSVDDEFAIHRKKVAGINESEFEQYNAFSEFAKETATQLLQQ